MLASCVTVRQHSIFEMVNDEKIFALHKGKYGNSVTYQFCMHVAPHTTTGQRNYFKYNVTDTKQTGNQGKIRIISLIPQPQSGP